ncbi:MAG: hypothetical protein ACK42A_01385 [Pyrinomonadaceae bacterium]|jgi:hypothetical protein
MNSRTLRDFTVPADIWPLVEKWAETEGFKLIESSDERRFYQKGDGVIVSSTRLVITRNGDKVKLETWLESNLFTRLFTLFLAPRELALEPGGIALAVPRSIARDAVNRLLIKLGQPLIS